MPNEQLPGMEQAFGALRQFTRARRASAEPLERCEFCSAGLSHEHPHLVELATRTIICACDPCALLFDNAATGKYKRVSRRALRLADFEMTDAQWDGLLIPINMAFFFRSSLENRVVALYPSPAGAVESLLPMEAWQEIAALPSPAITNEAGHRGAAGQPRGPCPRCGEGRVLHRSHG